MVGCDSRWDKVIYLVSSYWWKFYSYVPRLNLFWQTFIFYIATFGISQVMTRERFEQIYRFLHLANNDDQDDDPARSGVDLYTDNYYTSPQLFPTLYNKGENCCGTARVNQKGFLKCLVKVKKEDRGYFYYLSNGPLLAVTWFDRKCVFSFNNTPCTNFSTLYNPMIEPGWISDRCSLSSGHY